MTQTKMSFRAQPGLWQRFTDQANSLFLLRGPFLNHMIAAETSHLETDLAGRTLSLRAKRHISGMLKKQDPTSVNIEVEQSTVDHLNDVVRRHNLVLDAFLCRMIAFLRGSDSLLKYLDVPRQVDRRLEPMPSSPIEAMEAVRDDPLCE